MAVTMVCTDALVSGFGYYYCRKRGQVSRNRVCICIRSCHLGPILLRDCIEKPASRQQASSGPQDILPPPRPASAVRPRKNYDALSQYG